MLWLHCHSPLSHLILTGFSFYFGWLPLLLNIPTALCIPSPCFTFPIARGLTALLSLAAQASFPISLLLFLVEFCTAFSPITSQVPSLWRTRWICVEFIKCSLAVPAEVIANFVPLLCGSTLAMTFCMAMWQIDLRPHLIQAGMGMHILFFIGFYSFYRPSFSQGCMFSAWRKDRKVICLRTASISVTIYWLNAVKEERRCREASQDFGCFQTDLLCLAVTPLIYHSQQPHLRDTSRGALCQPVDFAHGAPRKCSLHFAVVSLSM